MAGDAVIRFSVLVPTRDRADLAAGCVRAILAQCGAPSFEILIIDQSAGEATRGGVARAVGEAASRGVVFVAREAAPQDGLASAAARSDVTSERGQPGPDEGPRVVWVRSRETGRSRALNTGWPLARGQWIAIIDDDCEPAPDWLGCLEAETRLAGPHEAIVGRVLPGPVEPGKAVPPATIEDTDPAEYAGRIDRDLVYPNIALPRRAFEEIGGFDVRMGVGTPLPGGEDNDFGYRLLRAGWRILYRPVPTVVHRAWRSEAERAALKRSYGIGQGAFYAKHLAAGDLFIAYRFVHDVLRTARAAAGAALRGWMPQCRGHLAFLRGLFVGVWRMSALMAGTGSRGERDGAVPQAPRRRSDANAGAPVAGAGDPWSAGPSPGRAAPGLMCDMDLSAGDVAPPVLGEASLAYVLFRWKGRPVGRLVVSCGEELSARAFRSVAFEASAAGILASEIEGTGGVDALRRLATLMDIDPPARLGASRGIGEADAQSRDAAPSPIPGAFEVSVVIATRDRPDDLAACIAALRALDPPPGEIVVADSASRDGAAVAAVARAAGAHLVRLERPGLSRARNAGAAAASGRFLAFLDDDCRVDRGWLEGLRAGFADEGVEAVTGLLLPLEIETEAQQLFLRYSHMDLRGFLPRRFDRASRPSRYWPIDAWRMGSGGNLTVRASSFARLGGFRAALGLGTPARGGEDLFLLWSIVRAGGSVVFRPDAMARHRHHRSIEALRQVLFGYGAGHAAYLRAAVASGAPRATVRFYKMSYYADRAARIARSLLGLWPVPAGLVLRELRGSMAGGDLARRAEDEAAREAAEDARSPSAETATKTT